MVSSSIMVSKFEIVFYSLLRLEMIMDVNMNMSGKDIK